jgi:hypothetical protein
MIFAKGSSINRKTKDLQFGALVTAALVGLALQAAAGQEKRKNLRAKC